MTPPVTYAVVAVRPDGHRTVLKMGVDAREARGYVEMLDMTYAKYTVEVEPPLPPDAKSEMPVMAHNAPIETGPYG